MNSEAIKAILRKFEADTEVLGGAGHYREHLDKATKELLALQEQAVIKELKKLSLAVIEPCEPDCDAVRHALHQGSWNAHLKIEDRISALTKEG